MFYNVETRHLLEISDVTGLLLFAELKFTNLKSA